MSGKREIVCDKLSVMGLFSNLTKPNKYYVKFIFTIGDSYFCHIEKVFGSEQTPEREKILYIEAALLFLKRYFNIADDRQKMPMKEILSDFIDQSGTNYMDLMAATEKMIFDNLNESERKSLATYATHGGALPGILSPDPIKNKGGEYSIYIVQNGSSFGIKFYMKLGADKILLSRLPVLFLQYIEKQLDDKSVEILRSRISIEVLS